MNFLKNLFSKTPEKYEQKADRLFDSGAYGPAKIEYENALDRLERQPDKDPEIKSRLEEKLIKSRESLADRHLKTGNELMETANYEDAAEIFHLALELTANTALTNEIEKKIQEIKKICIVEDSKDLLNNDSIQNLNSQASEDQEYSYQEQGEEYFTALCSALPDEEKKAYFSYGESFQLGYIYLNQGNFEKAAELLLQAHNENPVKKSFVPLELATACLNLGDYEKARSLLENFIEQYPESVRAYGLLCEIFWEINNFDDAWELLKSCSEQISNSLEICLLQGETLFLNQKFQEAENLFLEYIKTHGWEENIGRSLAQTYESLNLPEKALDIYSKLMNACQGCGRQPDPFLKQRYAEISLAMGDHSTGLLELFLSLIQEDPENRAHYYQRVSQIYKIQGNDVESQRFKTFAEKCQEE